MATVTGLYKKFKALTVGGIAVNVHSEVSKVIEKNKDWLEELNREQLEQGFNSLGEKITPEYRSLTYALDKNRRNPKPSFQTPDLKDTGSFHNAIFAKVGRKQIIFGSTDKKTPDLTKKYGKNIFGLTEKNKEFFVNNVVREEILKIIKKKLGLSL